MSTWRPPDDAPVVPWSRIAESLRLPQRGPNPHKLSPRIPENPRRAAVGVILWGRRDRRSQARAGPAGFRSPPASGRDRLPGRHGGIPGPGPAKHRKAGGRRGDWAQRWPLGAGLFSGWRRQDPDPLHAGVLPLGGARTPVHHGPGIGKGDHAAPRAPPGCALDHRTPAPHGHPFDAPRLQLVLDGWTVPLWGATAFVLKAWLDVLRGIA